MASKAHPGFKAVQKSIASKSGVSKERAGAILGAATRNASAAAKQANPRLKRVKGKMHEGGVIPESGAYEMQKGEQVIPAPKRDSLGAPVVTTRGAHPKQVVEAYPNNVEATGPGHYEVDCDSMKFVKE